MNEKRKRNLTATGLYLLLFFLNPRRVVAFRLGFDGIVFVLLAWFWINLKIIMDHRKKWSSLRFKKGLLFGNGKSKISSYLPGTLISIILYPYFPGAMSLLLPLEIAMIGEEMIHDWIS
ncbi:MAG: hypothetical protein Q4P28_06390 [Tissierellia bacterium]|nr:hypothetical protein [Tissierellia bacterium]